MIRNTTVAAGLDPATGQPTGYIRHVNLSAVTAPVAPYLDVDRARGIFEDAEQGRTDEYFRLIAEMFMSSPDLLAALQQRKSAFISTPLNFTMPKNPTLAMQRATDFLRRQCEDKDDFQAFLPHLPSGGIWPLACGRWWIKPGTRGNYYDLAGIDIVPWSLLDFSGGSDRQPGTLGIKEVDETGQPTLKLIFPEPRRGAPSRGWIVHRGHVLTDFPDCWGGPIRAAVMWWLFGVLVRALWANYVERGAYLLEGKHDPNDAAGKQTLLDAFAEAQRVSSIVVSTETEVKVHQLASQGGAQAHKDLVAYASDQVLKVILGSTMTVNASQNGFGGNQGAVQAAATGDIFASDTALAGRTLRAQLLAPLLQLNGFDPAIMPALNWGGQSEDQAALATTLATLKTAGLRPTAAALAEISERLGIALEPEGGAIKGPGPAAAAESVADVSLNGAQITALIDVVEKVKIGVLTRPAALSLIAAAFPSVSPARAAAILDGAEVRTFAPLLTLAAESARLDRASAAQLAAAGGNQFRRFQIPNTAAAALALCDSWLDTFTPDLAGSLAQTLAANAANGIA